MWDERVECLGKVQKKEDVQHILLEILAESEAPFAEGEGFKPPIPERGIPDFESSAIDHSANLP